MSLRISALYDILNNISENNIFLLWWSPVLDSDSFWILQKRLKKNNFAFLYE